LTVALVRSADLIVVMEPRQAKAIKSYFGPKSVRTIVAGDLDPLVGLTRNILDPWQRPAEAFEECFKRLDRCADEIQRILSGRR
jgi:protein-tyrosine-phosphatase